MSDQDPQHSSCDGKGFNYPLNIDFKLERSPAMAKEIQNPSYKTTILNEGARAGEYNSAGFEVPEMNFRELVDDIPNTAYATHAIHKHPAIFIPHIPRYLIRTFTTPSNESGDKTLVLDPFSGSGTTGLEAKLLGRDYLGIEINPLSKLVSKVATSPIPPTIAYVTQSEFMAYVEEIGLDYYERYDIDFPDKTSKNHWFEPSAIEGLTTLRKAIDHFDFSNLDVRARLGSENDIINELGWSDSIIQNRIRRWFVLMIANTVFNVSNADPSVSKAHKSKKMRKKLQENKHPPDVISTFSNELSNSCGMLMDFWNEAFEHANIGNEEYSDAFRVRPSYKENNPSSQANVDIRLDDARTFEIPEYREKVDIAITSPPYINAMNYYRGTKLRLFWIHDLINDEFEFSTLRKSIVGSNSATIEKTEKKWGLPVTIKDVWQGTPNEYKKSKLVDLDKDILEIYEGNLSESKHRAVVTWKFFAEDMPQALARSFQHLKPGAHFFFIIGENTIGGRKIKSHEYIAEIAQNLGKFECNVDQLGLNEGYDFLGFAWDEITNRDLFHGRNHTSGVIEGEWIVILQKPT